MEFSVSGTGTHAEVVEKGVYPFTGRKTGNSRFKQPGSGFGIVKAQIPDYIVMDIMGDFARSIKAESGCAVPDEAGDPAGIVCFRFGMQLRKKYTSVAVDILLPGLFPGFQIHGEMIGPPVVLLSERKDFLIHNAPSDKP